VLGWLNEAGCLKSWVNDGPIDSAFVIRAIDEWAAGLIMLTVLVLDNASLHRSKALQARLASWQEQGLFVFFLPTYSPHLNKAECLWRKMKYEWLPDSAYTSYETLKAAVEQILATYGQQYQIQFDPKHCIINSV